MNSCRSLSVVVPARNEEQTILSIVQEIAEVGEVDEILVIVNGCNDATAAMVASQPQTKVLTSPASDGKGGAVRLGLEHARNELVVMIDADLTGFVGAHITKLTSPLSDLGVAMSLGLFDRRRYWINRFYMRILPRYTGQRAFRRSLALQALPDVAFRKYRIEAGLNAYLARYGRIEGQILEDLWHRTKRDKHNVYLLGARKELSTVIIATGWLVLFQIHARLTQVARRFLR